MSMPETVRTARRVQALELRVAAAKADRDAAIRDRHKAGVGVTALSREVGMTRQGVYNILADVPTDLTVSTG